jgi:hypothetical protein
MLDTIAILFSCGMVLFVIVRLRHLEKPPHA